LGREPLAPHPGPMIHPGPPAGPEPRRTPPRAVIRHASMSSGRPALTPDGNRGAGRINEPLGRVAGGGGGQMGVVNLELVLLAGPDPVAGRGGRLDDAMIGERTVAEVELAGVDHVTVGAADDDPGDNRAAALVALGVEFGDARA